MLTPEPESNMDEECEYGCNQTHSEQQCPALKLSTLIDENDDSYWEQFSTEELHKMFRKEFITYFVMGAITDDVNLTLLRYISQYHNEKITFETAKECMSNLDMLDFILNDSKFNTKDLYELYVISVDNNKLLDSSVMSLILEHPKFDWNRYSPYDMLCVFMKGNKDPDSATYCAVTLKKGIVLFEMLLDR